MDLRNQLVERLQLAGSEMVLRSELSSTGAVLSRVGFTVAERS